MTPPPPSDTCATPSTSPPRCPHRSCSPIAPTTSPRFTAPVETRPRRPRSRPSARPPPERPASACRSSPGCPVKRSPQTAAMHRYAQTWHITSPHGSAHVPNTVGMTQLARLLGMPGMPLSAVTLSGTPSDGALRDLGPALDARAKREFRQRITELRADIDEAHANNDLGRLESAESELDAVMASLRSAVGLGGRDRPQGSGAERARVNVTRSLRRAISLIGQRIPALGAHLERSVQHRQRMLLRPGARRRDCTGRSRPDHDPAPTPHALPRNYWRETSMVGSPGTAGSGGRVELGLKAVVVPVHERSRLRGSSAA